jgi:RNA-directed DNA polymerase
MSAVARPAGAAPDAPIDWPSLNGKKVGRNVRRLQARIGKAVREGQWHQVKALVYLLTHSVSGRAVAIGRVVNKQGAKTPGVDGVTWDTPDDRSNAFHTRRRHGDQPQPLRRVSIPKSNGKRRAVGIPTITDRALQAFYLLTLDPIAEGLADGHSYGFRLQRSCADALEQGHNVLGSPPSPCWILEGDSKACFARMSHAWLLREWPRDRPWLRLWRQAGFLEKRVFFATTEGTPQGGSSAPVLAQRALDGLQGLLAARWMRTPKQQRRNQVHLVR